MMRIMVFGAGPERQEVMQAPREFIPGVRVYRLEHTERNPNVHCQDVQIFGDAAPQDRSSHRPKTQYHDLQGRGILRC